MYVEEQNVCKSRVFNLQTLSIIILLWIGVNPVIGQILAINGDFFRRCAEPEAVLNLKGEKMGWIVNLFLRKTGSGIKIQNYYFNFLSVIFTFSYTLVTGKLVQIITGILMKE